jgi:hypothetical protein
MDIDVDDDNGVNKKSIQGEPKRNQGQRENLFSIAVELLDNNKRVYETVKKYPISLVNWDNIHLIKLIGKLNIFLFNFYSILCFFYRIKRMNKL